ncbi:MAG: GDSL-type esterase/lipase family protein [Phycisphaeraceae bacterium]
MIAALLTLSSGLFASTQGPTRLSSDPSRWQVEIDRFKAEDAEQRSPEGAILFLGSSTIKGWETERLFPDEITLNRGFGGSTIPDVLEHFDDLVLPHRPRLIVFYSGDNDVAEGQLPIDVARSYRQVVQRVHQVLPETYLVLLPIKPSVSRWDSWPEMARANALMAEVCADDERLVYLDMTQTVLDEQGRPDPDAFRDGLHLTDALYEVWTDRVKGAIAVIDGISSQADRSVATAKRDMHAVPTEAPVEIDGKLDESVWQEAPVYWLDLGHDQADRPGSVQEGGEVRLAYDDDYLYVGVFLTDSDIVQESDEDQQMHFKTGDVVEVFLKPDSATWYWELYATPNGRRSAFFFPGSGRLPLPSAYTYQSNLRVGAQITGTLNAWRDHDTNWTAEFAIPREELAAQGVPLAPGQSWRMLIGRYNYSRYLEHPELSMYPRLLKTRFHSHGEYAPLKLLPR